MFFNRRNQTRFATFSRGVSLGVTGIALCAAALTLGSASPAAAVDSGGGLSIAPVSSNPGGGVTNRSTFSYKLDPGAKQSDSVVVQNLGKEDKTVVLYVANAFTTSGGLLGVKANEQAKTGPVEWLAFTTKLPSNTFEIKALTAVTVPFVITVPPNAPPGDYAFGIAVAPKAVNPDAVTGQNTVQVLQAAASLVELRVSGPLIPIVRVGSLKITSEPKLIPGIIDGSTKVSFELVNIGNQRINTVINIVERNIFNQVIHQEPAIQVGNVLPGSHLKLSRSWGNDPYIKGSVTVQVTTGTSTSATRSSNFWSVSWRTFVVPLLVIAAIFALRWRIRRRRELRDAAELAALKSGVPTSGRTEVSAGQP
ncbi:MAG: DUF916 domain-containing protein [Actinomycetota bacterium]|jgi:hypothetical protein